MESKVLNADGLLWHSTQCGLPLKPCKTFIQGLLQVYHRYTESMAFFFNQPDIRSYPGILAILRKQHGNIQF